MNRPQSDEANNRPPSQASIPADTHADIQSIIINAPASVIYPRLMRFGELPRYLTSIQKIDNVQANSFSCTSAVDGQEVQSDVMIMMRVPDRRITWQAVSEHFRVGVIFLDPLLGGRTKLTVKIRSIIEPVMLSEALRRYLRNFKQLIEGDGARASSD